MEMINIDSLQQLRQLKVGEIQDNKIYCLSFRIGNKKRIILFGSKLKQLKKESIVKEIDKEEK